MLPINNSVTVIVVSLHHSQQSTVPSCVEWSLKCRCTSGLFYEHQLKNNVENFSFNQYQPDCPAFPRDFWLHLANEQKDVLALSLRILKSLIGLLRAKFSIAVLNNMDATGIDTQTDIQNFSTIFQIDTQCVTVGQWY